MSRHTRVGENGENSANVWRIFIWGSKGFPLRVAILAQWYIWRIWRTWRTFTKISNEMAKGQFESGDFNEKGEFGENGKNGALSPKFGEWRGKGSTLRVPILAKMANIANIRQFWEKFKWDGKGALWKWGFSRKWRIWWEFVKALATTRIRWQRGPLWKYQSLRKNWNEIAKWPFESDDFDENGEIGVNDEYGQHSPKS